MIFVMLKSKRPKRVGVKEWKKIVKLKAWRPTKKIGDTVKKLIQGLEYDYTREEACRYAGISRQTFYNWLNSDQDFFDKISAAEDFVSTTAKKVWVWQILAWNYQASKDWLERKRPEEYSLKHIKANELMPRYEKIEISVID